MAMARECTSSSLAMGFDPKCNPTLSRIVKTGTRPRQFQEGKDFRVVTLESGAERRDLPIFTTTPGAIKLDAAEKPPVTRTDLPNIPGGFVLNNILTPQECDQMVQMSETMGYTEDAPVSLARHIRQNENCVWLSDPPLNDAIFERFKSALPPEVNGGPPVGMNQRWRLYKYNPGDIFRIHTDGSWPGSGLSEQGQLVRDIWGDRWSQFTCVIYLNDDLEGGQTRFYIPGEGDGSGELAKINGRLHRVEDVNPKQGAAICFFHGDHQWSHLHEAALVTNGTKYALRTDILYKLSGSPSGQEGWQAYYRKIK